MMETSNGDVQPIYLDYNATTPLEPSVLDAITNALRDCWGNPSSGYSQGVRARKVVDSSRRMVAEMIGATPDEILFTSGGTEANHLVFHSVVGDWRDRDMKSVPHVISCPIEHDAVVLPLKKLQDKGEIELTLLSIDSDTGSVKPDDVRAALKSNTRLVSLMLANNETGAIQPIREVSEILASWNARVPDNARKILLHTDAAQAIGKIKVDVEDLVVDYLTIVGHKFYGPRIGALYIRRTAKHSVPIQPLFYGGGQEKGLRPGTENTGMIAGLGQASLLVSQRLEEFSSSMEATRDELEKQLQERVELPLRFNHRFKAGSSLPNTCSVSVLGAKISGRQLLSRCPCLSASVGAACHSSSSDKPSHILLLSGVPEEDARCTLRLSVGRGTSKEEVASVAMEIGAALSTLSHE